MKRISRPFGAMLMALALCFSFSFSVLTFAPTMASAQESVVVESQKDSSAVESKSEVKSSEASIVAEDASDQAAIDSLPEVSNEKLFSHLMASIGGLKGAGTLAIAYAVSQFILFFLLSPLFASIFPKFENDGVKLLVAVGVHLVVGVLGLMVKDGLAFGIAITHSSTLAAVAVFANQLYKKVLAKKAKA